MNMKKNILNLFIASTLVLGISACSNDWLDRSPSDGLPSSEAITNFSDAFNALNGMYDAIQGTPDYPNYYGARMIYFGDVRGDDMQSTPAGTRTASSYLMNYTATSGAPEIWESPYIVIRRANSLIRAIEAGNVTDEPKEDVDNLKGQALMARALAHFDLVRVYSQPYFVSNGKGLGIPIVLEVKDASFTPGRNTIDEVYSQVITDLTNAILILKDKQSLSGTEIGYFNKWAAKALLSRVYLYKGDNQKAYETAVDIINNSPYKLWTSEEYATAWSKAGTSEVIFEIVNASNDDWVDRSSIGYLYAEAGYADAVMTKSFVDLVNASYPNDVRRRVMIPTAKDPSKLTWGDAKVFINKYPGREGTGDIRINNISILRLSETYLIAAEAASKLGDSGNAAKYLNAIVLRGNPNATALTPAQATLDRILQENRIEFVGEGHRFFDLLRNNKQVVRYTSDTDMGWHLPLSKESSSFDLTYFRAILPIPQDETNANPVIRAQQNPGY